jgi:hypothetical protein
MKIWLLTLALLAAFGGLISFVENHPTPTDDRPWWARVILVLLVATVVSIPTALAVVLVRR